MPGENSNVTHAIPAMITGSENHSVSAMPSIISKRLAISTRPRPNTSAILPDHGDATTPVVRYRREDRADLRLIETERRVDEPVADVVVQRHEAAHQYEAGRKKKRQSAVPQMRRKRAPMMLKPHGRGAA